MVHTPASETKAAPSKPPVNVPDLLKLLRKENSPSTRAAYETDLADFFDGDLSHPSLQRFLALDREGLINRLEEYRKQLQRQDLMPATINRRLASVRALIRCAYSNGLAHTPENGLIKGEAVKQESRRKGLRPAQVRRLLDLPGTNSVRGLRDTAVLRLMCGSAFRTSEIITLDVGDFSFCDSTITMRNGRRKEVLPINSATTYIIAAYLAASGHGGNPAAPLFCSLDHRPEFRGSRLTAKGVQHLVTSYGSDLEIRLSASMLRFTAIQTALAVTGGDVEKVRKFSRVADVRSIEACAGPHVLQEAKNGLHKSKRIRQRASEAVARSDQELLRARNVVSRAMALPTVTELREKNLRTAANPD